MFSPKIVAVTCAALLSLAGCAESGFRASGVDTYPPYPGKVELLKKRPEPGSYDLVGVVTVTGVSFTSDKRMFENLRELAGSRGADAVIPQSDIKDRPKTDGGEERRLAGYAIRRR